MNKNARVSIREWTHFLCALFYASALLTLVNIDGTINM